MFSRYGLIFTLDLNQFCSLLCCCLLFNFALLRNGCVASTDSGSSHDIQNAMFVTSPQLKYGRASYLQYDVR